MLQKLEQDKNEEEFSSPLLGFEGEIMEHSPEA